MAEKMTLHDRVEFALRDAGFDLDEASRIATLAESRLTQPAQAVDAGAGGWNALLAEAKRLFLRQMAERQPGIDWSDRFHKLSADTRLEWVMQAADRLISTRAIGNAQAEGWKVPDAKVVPYGSESGKKDYAYGYEKGHADGWNACRQAILSPPQPEE